MTRAAQTTVLRFTKVPGGTNGGCYHSNLNALYLNGKTSSQGMNWYHWKKAHYSVKRSEMKIRPQNF